MNIILTKPKLIQDKFKPKQTTQIKFELNHQKNINYFLQYLSHLFVS